ncbi:MAG: hypothetical protein ACLS4Z_05375 [Christensenellaceae bacterium]
MTDKTTPISVKQKTYEIEARFLSPYAMKWTRRRPRETGTAVRFRTDFQRRPRPYHLQQLFNA